MQHLWIFRTMAIVGLLCSLSAHGAADKPPAADALSEQIAQVKSAVEKAAQIGGEWRDTGEWIEQAQAALSKGDTATAQALLTKAQNEAQLGYLQAQVEQGVQPSQQDQSAMANLVKIPASAIQPSAATLKEGKEIAYDRQKGNCLACHAMDDGVSPGNIGPPLVQMQQRFKEKAALHQQIWDATVRNPNTPMPPFGRHQILSEEELAKVVEYIWTL